MKKALRLVAFCAILFLSSSFAFAATPFVSVTPQSVIQGEPILVTLDGVVGTSSVKSITFDATPLGLFLFRNKVSAFVGVDLHKKPGTYNVSVTLLDGTVLQQQITVGERPLVEAPLGIPEQLGGNTPQSQATLVSTLASENASLANIRTGTKAFWSAAFLWPLQNITVTDPYGYSRQTGGYTIAHKGTDFRAAQGTEVKAINRGVVRIVKNYRDYGKTIVVDHGLGLMSFYMHLSKINVNVGELVLPGEVIAHSGQTGYAEAPHLHLSVRLNGTSIDPMKFFELVK
jgi:murein DD-endopeptidase MepM/ murein hydrolase activator NlpD